MEFYVGNLYLTDFFFKIDGYLSVGVEDFFI